MNLFKPTPIGTQITRHKKNIKQRQLVLDNLDDKRKLVVDEFDLYKNSNNTCVNTFKKLEAKMEKIDKKIGNTEERVDGLHYELATLLQMKKKGVAAVRKTDYKK